MTRITHSRIIAATNVDLRGALHQGRMREDPFNRFCVVPIEVRERKEDIPPLTLSLASPRNIGSCGVSPQAMRMLLEGVEILCLDCACEAIAKKRLNQ